jgi:hypothetical protein
MPNGCGSPDVMWTCGTYWTAEGHSGDVKGLRARGFYYWRKTWPDTWGLIHEEVRPE